jgi:hypothetical protein
MIGACREVNKEVSESGLSAAPGVAHTYRAESVSQTSPEGGRPRMCRRCHSA